MLSPKPQTPPCAAHHAGRAPDWRSLPPRSRHDLCAVPCAFVLGCEILLLFRQHSGIINLYMLVVESRPEAFEVCHASASGNSANGQKRRTSHHGVNYTN